LTELKDNHQIVLQYADPQTGQPTDVFPDNPNGSQAAIAGICDKSGRIFGLMPHPEAYLSAYNHPLWPRQKHTNTLPARTPGQIIFDNAVSHITAKIS
jgi:phosphoribosylformylglycinamidine synthase